MNSVFSQIIGKENAKTMDIFPIDGFLLSVIPFFLFLYFLLFPKQLFRESISVLGRLLAIFIIIYYTSIHILYGILVCIFVIWYYQSDFLQYMLDMTREEEGFRMNPDNVTTSPNMDPPENETRSTNSSIVTKGSNLQDAYPSKIPPPIMEAEAFFQKNNCNSRKQLLYRNIEVKHPEVVPHIFPEIEFDEKPCNPCDSTCSFSINATKRFTETDLIPKQTHDQSSLSSIMEWTESLISQSDKKDPYIGVRSINASYV
jgi:hypothetical protein